MSLLIFCESPNSTKAVVTRRFMQPHLLDSGVREQLLSSGYVELSSIPDEPTVKKGEESVLYYSVEDGSLWWEVVPIPSEGQTVEEKINALLEQTKTADQRFRDLDPETTALDQYKAAKVAQLNEWYKREIAKGYTSVALGVPHTYPADDEAMTNLPMVIKRLEIAERQMDTAGVDIADPANRPTFEYLTLDAGALPHHLGELEQVFADGVDASAPVLQRFRTLRDQANAAQTNAEVAAIQP